MALRLNKHLEIVAIMIVSKLSYASFNYHIDKPRINDIHDYHLNKIRTHFYFFIKIYDLK